MTIHNTDKVIAMPTPVKVALDKAIKSSDVNASTKKIINIVLSEDVSFRFASLPDEVRKIIRNAVIADLKAKVPVYSSMTECAIAYGCTTPNVKKWRDEDRRGAESIRARGRGRGTKNKFNHLPDGSLVPFVPVAEKRNATKTSVEPVIVPVVEPVVKTTPSTKKAVKPTAKPVKVAKVTKPVAKPVVKSTKVAKVAKPVAKPVKVAKVTKTEPKVHRLVLKEVKGKGNTRQLKAVPIAKKPTKKPVKKSTK